MSITSRFDPEEGVDYGKCNDCPAVLIAEEHASAHMSATFDEARAQGGSRGHSVRVLNPKRADRIQREVGHIIEEAINDALEKIDDDLVQRHGVTEDEVSEALRWHSDFLDDWEENWKGQA